MEPNLPDLPAVPSDILRYEILNRLDPLSLLKYCKSSKDGAKYCNDPLFMKTYNKTISHDDYQLLLLDEAHKGKSKRFSTLIDKATFFDQIVDERTVWRAKIYFAELKEVQIIENMQISFVLFVAAIETIEEVIQITKSKKLNNQSKRRIEHLIRSASDNLADDEYIGTFLVNNLENDEIVMLFELTVDFKDKMRNSRDYKVPEAILGAVLKDNNLALFDRLRIIPMLPADIVINAVLEYGTLEQYLYVFEKDVHLDTDNAIPRNRDLYLYLLNKLDLLYFLPVGYVALDPYEWIKIINKIKNGEDKDLAELGNKDVIKAIVLSAYNAGYTYWATIVADSDLMKK